MLDLALSSACYSVFNKYYWTGWKCLSASIIVLSSITTDMSVYD